MKTTIKIKECQKINHRINQLCVCQGKGYLQQDGSPLPKIGHVRHFKVPAIFNPEGIDYDFEERKLKSIEIKKANKMNAKEVSVFLKESHETLWDDDIVAVLEWE